MAEVERQRLVRRDHLFEETTLAFVFDVADRERSNAKSIAPGQLRTIHEQVHAFDARWRHGVDVGNNEKFLGEFFVFFGDHLNAGGGGCENHFGVGDDVAFLLGGFAVDRFQVNAEALLGNRSILDDAFDAAMGDELNVGAFESGNDRGGKADDTGRPEYGDLGALPAAAEFEFQLALNAGDHRGRCREGARRIGKNRALERRHHGLLGRFHHVERHQGILAAHEEACAHAIVGRP